VWHGVLLVFGAPCQLPLLAGPEHGRTIPLPEGHMASHIERRKFFSHARWRGGGLAARRAWSTAGDAAGGLFPGRRAHDVASTARRIVALQTDP